MTCDICNEEPSYLVETEGQPALVCECGQILRLLLGDVGDSGLEDVSRPDAVQVG